MLGRIVHRRRPAVRSLALLLLSIFVIGAALPSFAQAPVATKIPEVTAKKGMVASAHPLASQAGLEILKAGGNAVDAAVATAFAIGVVELNATGLGGEGMMVIYLEGKKKAVAIDYRSAAPSLEKSDFRWPGEGRLAVAVPGTVAGLCLALQKYGTMKLSKVVEPAARLAENGFTVSPTLAGLIADSFDGISKNDALLAIVAPDGLPLEAGATLKNPDLAKSLRAIGAGGPDVFYKGAIADAIVADMEKNGGVMTKADLASYKAIEREPVRGSYHGYDIISAPPPVGGLTVIEILQILENFDLAKEPNLSPRNVHIMAEAMKRGYADNGAFIGDPGFVKIPVDALLSKEYAKARAAEISADAITPKVLPGDPTKEHPSTTHLSVVDKRGNMVALTQTISSFWGAKVAVPGTGILLNNEMQNWSAKGPNAYAPGKRMRTTISPTIIVKDGKTFATLGTPGAARIISTMAILISNLIDYKMGVQEAIEAPRFYTRDTDKGISIESRVPEETQNALKAMGYELSVLGDYDLFFGGAQAIIVDHKNKLFRGGADPRRDGAVLGY
jgi:gamma-glutamyltranspeptidase/glutathione hydrolase